ncbi:uncharacterized protein LOC144448621 [Glandiceps talaboti]
MDRITSLKPDNKVSPSENIPEQNAGENIQSGNDKVNKEHKIDMENKTEKVLDNTDASKPIPKKGAWAEVSSPVKASFLATHAKYVIVIGAVTTGLLAVAIVMGIVMGKGNNKGGLKDINGTDEQPTTTDGVVTLPAGCNCEQICTEVSTDVYDCSCEIGYSLNSDGRTCNDINECDGGTSGCDQLCTNTIGSYTCSCKEGKLLQDDLHTCIYDYEDVLSKSILFYEAQRSGTLPVDNRISWRGDSAQGDKGDNDEDLSGGYYDAGDHLKLGLPMAWSAGILTWGFIEFRDAYEAAGEVDNMLDCIKWFTDYFIKCHTNTNEFYVHVGSVSEDHTYWGRPEDMTMARPAYKVDAANPGSDCVGDTAAAMAAASIAFRDYDSAYSATLLAEAVSLYRFAYDYRGLYSDSVAEAKKVYDSSKYEDELTWAACWLYKATGEQQYLDDAVALFNAVPQPKSYAFDWNDVSMGHRLLLLNITGDAAYLKYVSTKFVDNYRPIGNLPYTAKGLVFRNNWGSLRYANSAAFVAIMAAHYGHYTSEYIDWALTQVHYALGDTGRSFVIGFGENPPQQPHHRASSCPDPPEACKWSTYNLDAPNPHTLTGALVGGPSNIDDEYSDDRSNHYTNEVTLDYNAGFQSAIAGLRHLQLVGLYPD